MYDIPAVLILALLLDRALGDPPDRFHTTAWIGGFIAFLKGRLPNTRGSGAILLTLASGVPAITAFVMLYALRDLPALGLVVAGLVLKLQVGWRGLRDHALPVVHALDAGDVVKAKVLVGGIVGRDTKGLTRENILSATIETTGENLPDGVISPLFYFTMGAALWGVPAGCATAVLYRAVNTLDAMVGYKKVGLEHIGYLSARGDDALNLLPARLSALLIALSSAFLGHGLMSPVRTALRDHGNTPSPNGGWPMAALAGSLGVRLEKPGVYTLGDPAGPLEAGKVREAIRIVDGAVILGVLALVTSVLLAGVLPKP